jgi:hypothetical protein
MGTCVEVPVAGYPDVVRTELKIPPELTIICGLAVGYSDPDFSGQQIMHRARPRCEARRVPRQRNPGKNTGRADCHLAARQGRPGRWPRNGLDKRKARTDDPKTKHPQGRARGNEGLGSARELCAVERAQPFADRPGQDARLEDQRLRLLHPHAYERGAHPQQPRADPQYRRSADLSQPYHRELSDSGYKLYAWYPA